MRKCELLRPSSSLKMRSSIRKPTIGREAITRGKVVTAKGKTDGPDMMIVGDLLTSGSQDIRSAHGGGS